MNFLAWYPGLPVDSRMNGAKLMRGYLSNSFFFLTFGHVSRASTGSCHEAGIGGEGGDNGCVDVMRDATQCHDNVHTSQFYLAVLIGMCEPWYGLLNVCPLCRCVL